MSEEWVKGLEILHTLTDVLDEEEFEYAIYVLNNAMEKDHG